MKKIVVMGIIAVVAVAVIAGGFYLFKNLNSLVAKAIEKHGSDATGTTVGVSGVDISLREGRGSVKNLRVGSPQEFKARDAFTLGDITVDIDVGSVRKDPIVIDEIRIQAPVVYAEVDAKGATNIDALRKQVDAQSSGSSGGGGTNKKIRIKTFVFDEGRIEVDATALGLDKREVALPTIRLSNVGGNSGAPPDEIAKIIIATFAKNVATQIGKSEVDRLIRGKLGESLSDKAKGLLKKIGD